MSQTPPKKPGVKEMRVSDWMRVKSASYDSQTATAAAPARDNVSSAQRREPEAPQARHDNGFETAARGAKTSPRGPVNPIRANPMGIGPRVLEALLPQSQSAPVAEASPITPIPAPADSLKTEPMPFDVMRFLGGLVERKNMILYWAFVGLIIGFIAGFLRGDTYKASMLLLAREVPTSVNMESGKDYRGKSLDKQTLAAILGSDTILQRLAPKLRPPVSPKELESYLDFAPSKGDTVALTYKGAMTAEDAVENVNAWGREIVALTQQIQSRENKDTRAFLERQTVEEQIKKSKADLSALRAKYSDGNPLVREKLAELEVLEQRLEEVRKTEAQKNEAMAEDDSQMQDMIGYFNVISPATLEGTEVKTRWFKATVAGIAGFFMLLALNITVTLGREAFNRVVRTPAELEYTISARHIQKIPRISTDSLDSIGDISTLWTRVLGASPREVVCFWTPAPHEQPHLVMQALLNLASVRSAPLIWIETEGETVRPPADFKRLELSQLNQNLDPGRYWVKLALHPLSTAEAEQITSTLIHVAARHRLPVWLSIQGPIVEPGLSFARRAHRLKILATLDLSTRAFWKGQSELLSQSVKTPTEWLAVNYIPWYRWSLHD